MSPTFNIQTRKFPSSGTTLTRDGAPLSSRLGLDLLLGTNNLNYTMPFAGFVYDFSTKHTGTTGDPGAPNTTPGCRGFYRGDAETFTDGEYFLGQLPVVFPAIGATRFCWTLGVTPLSPNIVSGDVYIDTITVYVAPAQYVAPIYDTFGEVLPFDPTQVAAPFGSSSNAVGLVVPNPTASPAYKFVDNSAGVVGSWLPFDARTHAGGLLISANLIVTASIRTPGKTSGEGDLGLLVNDFEWWTAPE